MKDVEITCEVFHNIDVVKRTLLEKGFNFVESFTLDDIYMYKKDNMDFFIKDGKISDTLIIRKVDDEDKKIVYKKRNYNSEGIEISTNKTILKVKDIEESERFLNILGYERYLRMIDINYMYENDKYAAYIQDIKDLGVFLEVEAKNIEDEEKAVLDLIEYVKDFGLNIGTKFDNKKSRIILSKKLFNKIKNTAKNYDINTEIKSMENMF